MGKEWNPESLVEVFESETAREILALASTESRSANELADHCEVSSPTIYRRINALLAYDLLDEELRIDTDGNHYRTFETTITSICFEFGDGDVVATVQRADEGDIVDRFEQFWSGLEGDYDD